MTKIYSKCKSSATQWCLLFLLVFLGLGSSLSAQVYISELSYNPCTAQGTDGDCEYFVVSNDGATAVDISGWSVNTAATFTFPGAAASMTTVIPAGGSLSVGASTDCAAFTFDLTALSGSLNNTGETLILVDDMSSSISSVTYDNVIANGDCDAVFFTSAGVVSSGTPSVAGAVATCDLQLSAGTAVCDAETDGVDTYTATFTFTGGGTVGYTVSSDAGAVVLTNDPDTDASGTITVTGINEGTPVTLTINGNNCTAITAMLASPTCEMVDPLACSITNVTATPTACDAGGTYDLMVCFDYANPASANVVITVDGVASTVAYPAVSGECVTLTTVAAGDATAGVAVTVTDEADASAAAFSATWDFEAENNTGASSDAVKATTIESEGVGMPAATYAGGNGSSFAASYNDFTIGGDEANAVATDEYVAYCVTAGAADIVVSSITFDVRVTSTGPTNYGIYGLNMSGLPVSLGGGAMPAAASSWGTVTFPLASAVTVPAGDTYCLRIFAWGATGTSGTMRLDNVVIAGACVMADACEGTADFDEPNCCSVAIEAVASCEDNGTFAAQDMFYVTVSSATGTGPWDLDINGTAVAGVTAFPVTAGPFAHSGAGIAMITVSATDTDNSCSGSVVLSEVLCGYVDGNGSGTTCECDDAPMGMAGTAFAQVAPGSFDAATTCMLYVLTDAAGIVVADGTGVSFNSTGFFSDLTSATYQIHAYNILISDKPAFSGGISAGDDVSTYDPDLCFSACNASATIEVDCPCICDTPQPEFASTSISVCEGDDAAIVPISGNVGSFDVNWNFDGETAAANTVTGSATGTTAIVGADNSGPTFPAGASGTSDSFSAGSWNGGAAEYFELCVDATTEGITLTDISFFIRASGTGPTGYDVYVSTDGYTTPVFSGTPPASFGSIVTISGLSSSAAVGGQVCVRILGTGASGTGTMVIDEVNFMGTLQADAVYNFYDADPTLGGATLLAMEVASYDHPITEATSPETVWVTCLPVGGCESLPIPVEVSANTGGSLACNDNIQISLGSTCEFTVYPDVVLEAPDGSYTVVIFDANGDVIPGATLTDIHVGGTFGYQVFDDCNGNSCWGNIKVEDKISPVAETCPCEFGSTTIDDVECVMSCLDDADDVIEAPMFSDNCAGDITLTPVDVLISDAECSAVEYRRYWISNAAGHSSLADTLCTQTYFVAPLGFDDVEFPHAVILECDGSDDQCSLEALVAYYDDKNTSVNEAIPYVFPHFVDGSGNIHQIGGGEMVCNLMAGFTDQEFPTACEAGTKKLRTWTVIDWCSGATSVGSQVIEVVDTTPPVFVAPVDDVVSIEAWICVTAYRLPELEHPATDNCSDDIEFNIYVNGTLQSNKSIGSILSLAVGKHVISYEAVDGCGNKDKQDYHLEVVDLVPPVPVCEDEVIVSLTPDQNEGIGKVFANSLNVGSHDAGCGNQLWFKVIRMDDLNNTTDGYYNNDGPDGGPDYTGYPEPYFTSSCGGANSDDYPDLLIPDGKGGFDFVYTGPNVWFDDYVKVCCDDVGQTINVILRVFDVNPYFDEDADGEVDDFESSVNPKRFRNELAGHYNDCMVRITVQSKIAPNIICPPDAEIACSDPLEPEVNSALGTAYIDGVCVGGNVAYYDTEDLVDPVCGGGIIIRTWFYDFKENGILDPITEELSTQCHQMIFVGEGDEFDPSTIKFPPHYTGESYPGLNIECKSNGDQEIKSASIPMPSPYDCMDAVTCIPEWEDTDCTLIGYSLDVDTVFFEDDACMKILNHWSVIDWCTWEPNTNGGTNPGDDDSGTDDFVAIGDWSLGNCGDAESCFDGDLNNDGRRDDGVEKYNTYFSLVDGAFDEDGHYDFTQVIKIINTTKPVIENCDEVTIGTDSDCLGQLIVSNTATDAEDCASAWLKWDVEILDVHWNTIATYEAKTANGATMEVDAGAHGIGSYYVRWRVSDGCNNITNCTQVYTIRDLKAPTPYCIQDISTTVMQSGGISIWANDFNLGSFDNCSAQSDLVYSWSGDDYVNGVSVTCVGGGGDYEIQNGKSQVFELEMWVIDEAGNKDYCYVQLRVEDNLGVCDDVEPGSFVSVEGGVETELGEGVEEAEIMISNNFLTEFPAMDMTSNAGEYAFDNLPLNQRYEVTASRDGDYLNGVSTLDIVLMQQHILGTQNLNSAYKVIAADINSDERVSASDIVELRKLILGIYNELPNNESWRFVDAQQAFNTIDRPWPFTEVMIINNLTQDITDVDFVGVKIGDVNGNAKANSATNVENRSNKTMTFHAVDQEVSVDQLVSVAVYADNFVDVYGYQFTMDHAGLEFVEVQSGALEMNTSNVADFGDRLTVSWSEHDAQSSTKALFTMVFKAQVNGDLNQLLALNSKLTAAEAYTTEAYEINNVELDWRDANGTVIEAGFVLNQNEPNPFTDKTMISFELPKANLATISIMDVTGKLIKVIEKQFVKGYNEINLTKDQLSATGVLYYELTSGELTATRKMIIIE